ncbi:MAG: MurR/RpiR family transcriptional regulator [Desulfitobacterium hafniense]|nr:MurR/RpiR family transcriptional regulator [Desulfitobacterium hafniense]
MNLNVLQQLEKQIPTLTDSQRKVADYILKNTVEVAFLTIDQLSGVVGTSTSTIMRLAFSMGYSGYANFQKDLQELLRNRVAPSMRLHAVTKELGRNDLLAQCAENQIKNIRETVGMLSEDTLNNVLDEILSANMIYCVGMRTSYSVSHYLYQGLNRLQRNCEMVTLGNGYLPERMLSIGPSDVVIALTLPRYQKMVVNVAQLAKERGAKVISMTDGYSSPIAPFSDILLPFSYGSLAFHNSVFGAMLIADYIITSIALKQPELTRRRLEEAEEIFDKWGMLVTK